MDKQTVVHHIIEYCSVVKINKLSIHENTWKKFRYMLLGKRSQSEKDIYFMSPSIWK